MKVLKFGGSSVGTPERILEVIEIVNTAIERERREQGPHAERYPLAVVVSAFKGVTDTLIRLGMLAFRNDDSFRAELDKLVNRHIEAVQQLIPAAGRSSVLANVKVLFNELEDILQGVYLVRELSKRTQDLLMSFGERASAYIVSEAFKAQRVEAQFLDARQIIISDNNFGNARALDITTEKIRDYFASHSALQVVTGFIASTVAQETTTLGRGGSDYTASILGAALASPEIEIWTDVDGMLTADPNKVKKAFSLKQVSFDEAMELCHFGAKVIYPPTIQPALIKGIPIRILNTFNPSFAGTLITKEPGQHDYAITGVTSISDAALLLLEGSGMVGVSGVSMRLFGALAKRKISVILITQASSEHTICFAVEPNVVDEACEAVDSEFALERRSGLIDGVRVEKNLAIISVVGENMRNTPGIAGTMFAALGRNGVNVVAIAQGSSELNISAVISKTHEVKALNALHDAFFLSGTRALNVYLAGAGLVGGTLLKQMQAQKKALQENLAIELKLVGLINSKKMLLDDDGIALENCKVLLNEKGQKSELKTFVSEMRSRNQSNSVFVDCTASEATVDLYEELLNSNISVVTPNKKAQAGDLPRYRRIKAAARKRGVEFLYETSVGASLPVINTLNDLLCSGDSIKRIEAVLSGTLSFIFNSFDGTAPFSKVVLQAKEKGYTEPDPRDDLSGLDVARKLLILAREMGYALELKDVSLESLVPAELVKLTSAEEFLAKLPTFDAFFEEKRRKAAEKGAKLCYMALLDCEANPQTKTALRAKIELSEVSQSHPFYSLSGSDNIISFTTRRYNERPLVVKGPGAGAEVTAAGVFADVIRLGRKW